VHHLFHEDGVGDLQTPFWAPSYISLALYILSYNCPNDKGSTSALKIIHLRVVEIDERWPQGMLRGFYKCMDGTREIFRKRYLL
jgi:hypothetical protein